MFDRRSCPGFAARARGFVLPLCLVALGLAGAPACGHPDEPAAADRAARLDRLLGTYAEAGAFSGVALVADASGVLLERGYGLANREWDIPNRPDARYRIGSVTKQFTAALILDLAEDGLLSLDAHLSDVVPWYRADTGARVTIRQLLDHTSGIDRRGVPRLIRERPGRAMPLREEIETYCSGDLDGQPGAQFAYNNAGYLILGAVVEEVTGRPYATVLEERILRPAGLVDTGLYDPEAVLPRRAEGYERGGRKPAFVHALLAGSAGGLYSTARDLYRWDQALYTDGILSAASRGAMFTPGPGDYNCGWWIVDLPVGRAGRTVRATLHPGEGDGFESLFVRLPDERVTVVLIHNEGRTYLRGIAAGLLDIVFGESPRLSVAPLLRHRLDTEGAAAGAWFRRARAEAPGDWLVEEAELNRLGYELLGSGRADDAILVLTLMTEAFPASANGCDSLAEAYALSGDRERALAHYRRALELDPGFAHAADMVRKLEAE